MLKSMINPDLSGKHTKLILTFLFFTFLSTNLFAQYPEWVSRYNGPANGSDGASSIALDDSGNVYVTGSSTGIGTGTDCVTIKYNSNGDTLWVRRYNGPGNSSDVARSIGVDGLGNVYIAGSSVGIGTAGDYLTIKYNTSGVQQWVQRYNGPENRNDEALSMAVDDSGNVHVTGYRKISDTSSIYLTIKYNSSGVQQWITGVYEPAWRCIARAIGLDSSGNVYVTGETGMNYYGKNSDFCTVKYNSAGVLQWKALWYNPPFDNTHDRAYSIAVEKSGYVYVYGKQMYNFPYGTDWNVIIKYNSGGGLIWELGIGYTLKVNSMAVDNLGSVYFTGYTGGSIGSYATGKFTGPGFPGHPWEWYRYYTGPVGGRNSASSIALDDSANVYVTGSSPGIGTSSDYATLKYNNNGVQQWVQRYNGTGNAGDGASSIAVDNLGNVYVTGSSAGSGTGNDYATIKYSTTSPILTAFNLQSPPAGDTITSLPNSSTPIMFSWNISAPYASYKWIFGTSLPVRLITLPTGLDTLSLTMTLGELDNILAGLGVTPGNQLSGAWDVWAFRQNPPQNDSLKAANGPRAITLKRGIPALTAFNLSSPPNGTQINTSSFNNTFVHMKWTRSGYGTTYKWKFGSPTIANPLFVFEANTSGYDSVFSIRNSSLDSALASIGVLTGEVKIGEWAVWAYNGLDSLKSTQTYSLKLRRANLIVLFYDPFLTGTGNWTIINNGGTCVWQTFASPYPNNYTLPATSSSPIFSADADECGSGTTTITTATVANNINCIGYEDILLEFDNDWRTYTNLDSAIVEASYNGGTTWVPIISWGGTDVRNTHEVKPLPGATNIPNLKVRFRSIQPGWDWWWTIDNVTIKGYLLTGVAKNEGQIPTTYALSQNYPNPFNPSTKIKFDIPMLSFVTLIIYDVLGREIKTLVDEKLNAGRYEVDWNGSSYPSGVYFYKMITYEYVSVKKMILIK